MQLLDPFSRFQSLPGKRGTLHHSGWITSPWPELLNEIEGPGFQGKTRGNFAFVYLPSDEKSPTVAAVDHLASIPLFIGPRFFSSQFADLVSVEKENGLVPLYNREFFWESNLFWGYTASERTIIQEILRIPQGCYWQDGKIHKYFDLNDHVDTQVLTVDEFSHTLEKVFRKGMGDSNALLASGGTDSATLMAVVAKLKVAKQFKIVSICSDVETQNEGRLVNRLAEKLDLQIHFFNTPILRVKKDRLPSDYPSEMFLWKDYSFLYRRMALENVDPEAQLQSHFTGECGDQLFGGPKLDKHVPLILQNPRWTPRDIARQYLHLSMRESAPEWQGYLSSPLVNMYKAADKECFEKVYEESVDRIATFFESVRTPDILNRLLHINLIFKGPYRLFHYSQDKRRFFHPFADWEMVSLALRSRSQDKIYNGGRLKEIFYQSYKDYLINEIWEAPKIGTSIPIQ